MLLEWGVSPWDFLRAPWHLRRKMFKFYQWRVTRHNQMQKKAEMERKAKAATRKGRR